jgi:hypothetical protein
MMYCASAMAAIFFRVRTPPQQQISAARNPEPALDELLELVDP